uniref:Uncharacterized protein n=1 Tax=Ascaris lumbricoides TaxID=6252 RepID=A0A0M3HVX9_ASCLU
MSFSSRSIDFHCSELRTRSLNPLITVSIIDF